MIFLDEPDDERGIFTIVIALQDGSFISTVLCSLQLAEFLHAVVHYYAITNDLHM